MATVIRAEISEKNKYYIDKHRHYELKHFCLQYPIWKRKYDSLGIFNVASSTTDKLPSSNMPSDPTGTCATMRVHYGERIELIERIAREADPYLYKYILRAVTEGLSFTYLKARLEIPCGRDMYYDRYRRFFWLLSEARK